MRVVILGLEEKKLEETEVETRRGGSRQRGERILNVQSVLDSRPQCGRKAGFMRGFSHVT